MMKRLIDLVNSIPPETALPHQHEVFNKVWDESPDQRKVSAIMRETLRAVPDWFFQPFGDDIAAYISFRRLRRTVHEMAQIANLPADWRQDYAIAVVSDAVVWERFKADKQLPLWREWTAHDAVNSGNSWRWPWIALTLTIGADGQIVPPEKELEMLTALFNIEAKRLKECRHCQRIFWAQWINMATCDTRCGNAFRQSEKRERDLREKEKLAERRKKP